MTKKINLICLALALLISTAVICTAQSWIDGSGSDWTNGDGSGSDWTTNDFNNGNNGGNNQNTGSWGSPTPAEESEPNEGAYFPSSVSESSETLIEETASYQFADVMGSRPMMAQYMGGGGSSKNIFWIVSKDGTKHWISVNIPCQHYARLLIIPSTSGQLIMEELYPTGQVQTYNYGYVKAYKQYKKWFFADTSGTHQLRYRIDNGPYSDILTFHVGNCGGGGRICPCCGRPL